MDADGWRHILCSKSYGKVSVNLCQAIADLAKKLCREDIHPDSLNEFVACRLIPLDKGDDKFGNPGVRPIGIGEILRRLIGKVVVGNIKDDIIEAAGPLQTCAGLNSGIEATIHAMRRVFEDDSTEAVMLVDAENAFNNLNREAAIHNIKQVCPSFYRYLKNTYQLPAKMIINDQTGHEELLSEEGSTQGDVTAMAMYAIGTKPLLDELAEAVDQNDCKQAWYADDSSGAGKLAVMRKWWDILNSSGPKYGYFPNAQKTTLIVKPALMDEAKKIFEDTGVTAKTEGDRHLGAAIGSPEFKEKFVSKKVNDWIKDVEQLTLIAKDEPQLAYAAYTKALCMRWSYLQRVVDDISHLFLPLEDVIRNKFIPALVGRTVTPLERRMLALPVRLGGIGIQNPVKTADIEFATSVKNTELLTHIIYNQERTLENYDQAKVTETVKQTKAEQTKRYEEEFDNIKSLSTDDLKRCLDLAKEKGSGSWLIALPIQSLGYVLNKQEFRDSICLRYNWKIPNTPLYCSCGVRNSVDHSLNCKSGGYIMMRHDRIRDLEASILKDVCKDVKVEPELQPVGNVLLDGSTEAERARLDVSAVGIYSPLERTFLDVRIMHPNSTSYQGKSLGKIYALHEKEKKQKYNQRILQVEKASFTPLVFSTSGGMAPECTNFHKKVAGLIAKKTKEDYSKVMSHLRTRIRFTLLKSILIAIRGKGGKKTREGARVSDISFDTMPSVEGYEV